MKKSVPTSVDWLEFEIPTVDEDGEPTTEAWRVHMSFLTSNWTCIYGQGCPGLFGTHESRITPDIGCCTKSFWFSDQDDYDKVEKMMGELTDDDWDSELRKHVEKNGWSIIYKHEQQDENGNVIKDLVGKGKVVDGGCVFANRSNGSVGSTGKIGCAFHHLGERTGRTNHTETMPWVCWQLPFKFHFDEEDEVNVLYPWDIDQWGSPDEDGTHDSWCSWWCIDTPDAYVGDKPVFVAMEQELRTLMGNEPYEKMVELIRARSGNIVGEMAGRVFNDGRPTLPLFIGNRVPKREQHHDHQPASSTQPGSSPSRDELPG